MKRHNIISGTKFYKLNSKAKKISKKAFFMEFYRILHTSYLMNDGTFSCHETLISEFSKTFNSEPNQTSLDYINEFSKCLCNDTLINSIKDSKPYPNKVALKSLAVETGFDVWLIECAERHQKPRIKDFKKWFPLEMDPELKMIIERFINCRMPSLKNIPGLYDIFFPYRNMLYNFYGKLICLYSADHIETEAAIAPVYVEPVDMDNSIQEPVLETVVIEAEQVIEEEKNEAEDAVTEETVVEEAVTEVVETTEIVVEEDIEDITDKTAVKEIIEETSDEAAKEMVAEIEAFDNKATEADMDDALREVEVKEISSDSTEFFARIKSNEAVLNEKSVEILHNIQLEEPSQKAGNGHIKASYGTQSVYKKKPSFKLPKKEEVLSNKQVQGLLVGVAVASIISVPLAIYLSKKK